MADDMVVFEEILARLDVEDVLRCKSVCKSWYFLISTNYFVKAHLKHSYNNNLKLGHLRIRLRRDIYTPFMDISSRMVGSCNGLVCISPDLAEFLVTNPSTLEFKKLPMLPYKDRNKLCWGFGYDSSTDDYKVVVGFNESDRHMRFQVLTLKSNKWEFIRDNENNFAYNFSHFGYGFLYNGALHWFLDDVKKKKKTVILSFDLSLEIFKEVPQPDDANYVCDNSNILGTFEGCLCICRTCYNCMPHACTHLQIWVMKNYNSWQLLPRDYEGNKYAVATSACELGCDPYKTWRLSVDDKGNIDLSWQSWCNIACPIFVKSLVSPYAQDKEEGTQEER